MLQLAMSERDSQPCTGPVHEVMVPVRAPFTLAGASAFLAALRSACHVIHTYSGPHDPRQSFIMTRLTQAA